MPETFTGADIASAVDASTTATSSASPDATAAASPDPSSPASASAPTTAAPAVDDDSPDAPLSGPIPPERHKRILENARKKEAERLSREWNDRYGFAQTDDPQEIRAAIALRRQLDADPANVVASLWDRVQSNPVLAPQLKSHAARILGQRPAAAPAEGMPEPDVPTLDEHNRPGQMVYSAAQLQKLLEWKERRSEQQTQEKLAPLLEAHAQAEQEREWQAVATKADTFAATTLESVAKLPGFKEHAKEILQRYEALPTLRDPQTGWLVPDPRDPRTEDRKLLDIYHDVVLPTFSREATQAAVHDLQQKARGTTLNPSGSGAAEPFDHKRATWQESLQHEWNKRIGKR